MTPAERQAWNDELGSRFLKPDEEVHRESGHDWTRTHAMRCPVCEIVFYGYELLGKPIQPYLNPDRITCGHPLCYASEEREKMRKDPVYQKTARDYYAARNNSGQQAQDPKPKNFKLTKFGE